MRKTPVTLGTKSVDHRLSLNVLQLGIAPPMDDLYGKAEFTAEEIGAMRRALDECGVRDMPAFRKVRYALDNELGE